MYVIDNLIELKVLLRASRRFHLYGAGFPAVNFLQSLKSCDVYVDIIDVLVTDANKNPSSLGGIPVVQCNKETLCSEDCILLTVNENVRQEIIDYLEDCRAELVEPSPSIFYNDVYNCIRPFIEKFPHNLSALNTPMEGEPKRRLWTCWWQGENQAPDIVKACWKSQREHLPEEVQHVVITKDNCSLYINIPEYVMEKFRDGGNLPAHLSDFIRVCLLYRYGGLWLDSTVLVLQDIPQKCWELPLYTWRFDKTHFCSETIWTTWFMGSLKGSILFQFVMEAFLYYFKHYEKLKYYYEIDYFIAICTNTVSGVLEQFHQIPYNNETAAELGNHLTEEYTQDKFQQYCGGSYLQKLTRHLVQYSENSIYNYILKTYGV